MNGIVSGTKVSACPTACCGGALAGAGGIAGATVAAGVGAATGVAGTGALAAATGGLADCGPFGRDVAKYTAAARAIATSGAATAAGTTHPGRAATAGFAAVIAA